MMATKALNVAETHQQSFRRAVEAGVKIAMGTDAGVGRHGDNGQELVLMAENGMTPMQTIVASTSSAAQLLRLDSDLGTLEAGKLADVIIVDGDVLSDIRKIADPANVKLVLKGGQAAKNTLAAAVPTLTGLA
jgi:imidazolonepropionase-like amidohydrolase